ncbi:Uncharacterized protein FKW44_019503, partial [Caligus rogercresseyi]
HNGDRVVFFSDEKTFTVDPVYNKQNDRVICFGNVSNVIRASPRPNSGLRDDVGDRGINRGQDAADLVPDRVSKITKKSGSHHTCSSKMGLLPNTCKAVQDWMETNMKFWPKTMCHHRAPT